MHFADLVKNVRSVAGLSTCLQFQAGQNDVTLTQPGCQVQLKMAASTVTSFETNFFRIAGTSETKTLVSEKAKRLLATHEDNKVSFLE